MPNGTIIGGRHPVTAWPEEIVDGCMDREKVLHLARGFEAAHLAFLLAGRLMRDFRLIVQALVLAVLDAGQDLFAGCPVAVQFIGDDHPRHVA